MLFPEHVLLPYPQSNPPLPPSRPSRDPAGTFFHKINFHLPCASRGAQSGTQDEPKCSKSAKKSCQKLTFGSQKRDVYVRNWREWPLVKTSAGAMFSSHLKVRAPPFLLRNSPREPIAHRERSFSHFCLHFWRPSGAQGRPRETKSAQKDSQSLPGDT